MVFFPNKIVIYSLIRYWFEDRFIYKIFKYFKSPFTHKFSFKFRKTSKGLSKIQLDNFKQPEVNLFTNEINTIQCFNNYI